MNPPCYIIEEAILRRNLTLIKQVAEEAGVEIILAFKAFALWKTFPIFREYIRHTTASSPFEARLALEQFGSKAHTYSPAYEESTFADIVRCSSHITFNSLSQFHRFASSPPLSPPPGRGELDGGWGEPEGGWGVAGVSLGLRVNPEYSEIATDLYNPCAPGSRFGVVAEDLPTTLPAELDGFHIHCHCESSAEAFVRTLERVEEKFGRWLPQLKWINFGGGHLLTRQGYNVQLLIDTLVGFRQRWPGLRVILEPGSAFAWETGTLNAEVVDIVCNHGIRTAILNVSFTCHMPDCLEMPYTPAVRGASIVEQPTGEHVYRLGGNSCLSGDYMGYWQFDHELALGEEIIFEDMIHYTTVKTHMFNGIAHPAIAMRRTDGSLQMLREFTYEDYRDRMD